MPIIGPQHLYGCLPWSINVGWVGEIMAGFEIEELDAIEPRSNALLVGHEAAEAEFFASVESGQLHVLG